MTAGAPKPKRRMRSELLSLSIVLATPVVLMALFPYKALAYRPGADAPRSNPSCAFVRLSKDAEAKALEKVRAALSVRRGGDVSLTADLSLSTLPEEPPRAIVSETDMGLFPEPPVAAGGFVPFPPSLASPEPGKMSEAESADAPAAFTREDLLKIQID